MGGEDRSHREPPGTAQAEPDACQPFVEVCNHMGLLLALGQELWGNRDRATVSTCVVKTISNPQRGPGSRGEAYLSPLLHRVDGGPLKSPQERNYKSLRQLDQLILSLEADGNCSYFWPNF